MLTNELNWVVRRDVWREKAIEIRAEFERNRCASLLFSTLIVASEIIVNVAVADYLDVSVRNVIDPRAVGQIIAQAEARLVQTTHPDPYIRACPPTFRELLMCLLTLTSTRSCSPAVLYPGGTK